jgi:predicted esterase
MFTLTGCTAETGHPEESPTAPVTGAEDAPAARPPILGGSETPTADDAADEDELAAVNGDGLAPSTDPMGVASSALQAKASRCVTKGQGGAFKTRRFRTFVANDGTTSRYHLYAQGPWTGAPGLLVYLHETGAYSFDHTEWKLDAIAATARAHDLMTLAVHTPTNDATWLALDRTRGLHNGGFLTELIDKVVRQRFAINEARALLVGYSGGAVFTTSWYLPTHGEDFCGGGAILFGEGKPPWDPMPLGHTYDPRFVSRFKLHFYAGQDDPYLPDSIEGARFYTKLGFRVTEQHPAGVGHDDIPLADVIDRRLDGGFLPAP